MQDFTDFLSKCFIKDMSRPSAADLQRHPWVRKAQPPQEEQEQSATILELRKFSRSRGRGTGGMLMVRRHLAVSWHANAIFARPPRRRKTRTMRPISA